MSDEKDAKGILEQPQPTNEDTITAGTYAKKRAKKRVRTAFFAWQLAALEARFQVQQYLVGEQRWQFADQLGLGEVQVKVWFQNRRIRLRRDQRMARRQQREALLAETTINEDQMQKNGGDTMEKTDDACASM